MKRFINRGWAIIRNHEMATTVVVGGILGIVGSMVRVDLPPMSAAIVVAVPVGACVGFAWLQQRAIAALREHEARALCAKYARAWPARDGWRWYGHKTASVERLVMDLPWQGPAERLAPWSRDEGQDADYPAVLWIFGTIRGVAIDDKTLFERDSNGELHRASGKRARYGLFAAHCD